MTTLVSSVQVGNLTDTVNIPIQNPTISWKITSETPNWKQAWAEIAFDNAIVRIEGDASVNVPWPFRPLLPRQKADVRVRVAGTTGDVSPWSDSVNLFAAFLADGEWVAPMIGVSELVNRAQPVLLRKEFVAAKPVASAVLYVAALGVYDVFINGEDVDDQILKPGWTPYRSRLIHESTDVTDLVAEGANAIGISLAGGWFTEGFGFNPEELEYYGQQPAVSAQLILNYIDGTTETITTDTTWRGWQNGPISYSGIYNGEHYDARLEIPNWADPGFDDANWERVTKIDSDVVPSARNSPAVRVTDELNVVKEFNSPSGKRLLDFGQNLVGRLKITVEGEEGTVITLRHAEVLENGQLGVRPLRTAKATDTYTLRGGGAENWAPRFTFHGFRFAEITTSHPLKSEPTVVAQVIHSDMRRTGWFESSNELLNRFHENVVWGMRGNFLYLPTDCPQRDERMGWTGDIQVFAPTASFLYKADAFLGSWLQDLAIEQVKTGDGSVPFVIPAVTWDVMNARSAWGDAATVVPTVVHERFGDIDVLRAQLGSMKAWADHLNELAGSRRLWEGSLQFADWLDPTAPPNDPAKAQTDQDLVSSAYFYLSTKLVAKAARVLGEQKLADAYDGRAMEIKAAFLAEYVTASGRMMSDAQTAYALGIQFGLFANEDQRQRMGDRLAELVRRDGYTIATGFVGTPLITDALSATGHIAVVDRLLFQTKCPSWLYPVTMGATTIWERWDSMLPDGTINPGQMTSFNHYALGGIADWLHRRVAGIAPAEPGYRKIRIDPLPLPSLDHAKAILDSPYGLIESQWYREGGSVTIEVMIPANTEAEVFLPGSTTPKEVGSGSHNWTVESSVDTVRPSMDMTLAELADHPEVLESVAAAIASIRPKYGLRFLKRTPWTKRRTLANALKAFPREISEVVRAALTS